VRLFSFPAIRESQKGETKMRESEHECIDNGVKQLGFNDYFIAHVAFKWQENSKDAPELVARWKLAWARYASLSERYRELIHKMRSLRLHPEEVSRLYKEIDAGFDALHPEIETLSKDLHAWSETWELVQDDEVA
jgi:hypothetical protein